MSYRLSIVPSGVPSGASSGPARPALARALARLHQQLAAGEMPCLAIARQRADLAALGREARRIAGGSDHVLVLGMGGASLAGAALAAIAPPSRARLHIVDNIDPVSWQRLLADLDPARSHVLAISKSGETAETLALFLLALDWLAAGGAGGRATAIAGPGPCALRAIAHGRALPVLDHPPDIGGRFSALTLAGLLPAAIAGLDAAAVRQGAAAILDDLLAHGLESAPGLGAAALMAGEAGADDAPGASVQVLMPYGDRLAPLARWWCQLWGESLGKRGQGSTPLAAAGAGDQHSQLQLWLAGARRHMVTVIAPVAPSGPGDNFPLPPSGLARLGWLEGRSLGALFAAECEATCESLAAAGVPLRRLELERLDARAMGALFAHFMIETLLVAGAIGVCPFGQPAVEDGKRRAREKLAAACPPPGAGGP